MKRHAAECIKNQIIARSTNLQLNGKLSVKLVRMYKKDQMTRTV